MSDPAGHGALPYTPLPDVDEVPHLSVAERIARGHAAREVVPLDRHGRWAPAPNRPDPIDVLERQSANRITELVPIRYGRMATSDFAFFRGGAAVMASDLAGTPTSGIRTQLCGDAHLMNFGLFRTPERSLVFDLNDFDETIPGPWEWDLKRLAASVEVAGRDLGLGRKARRDLVLGCAASYRTAMAHFAEESNLTVWYERLDVESFVKDVRTMKSPDRKPVEALVRKALRRDNATAFDKLVELRDGVPRLKADPPLLMPVAVLLKEEERRRYVSVMRDFLHQYRHTLAPDRRALLDNYSYVDMAHKVVGVGSVGTRCWVVLMIGRDANDPLVLQLKEATPSVLEPYAGPSVHRRAGQRVVEGQRLMQSASDPLLGWYRLRALDGTRRDFYVRQMWDGKASVDLTKLSSRGLARYAQLCGWTLARGHATSGDRIAIAAYVGDTDELDTAIADFAAAYAEVNESDHAALVQAIESGRLTATPDV